MNNKTFFANRIQQVQSSAIFEINMQASILKKQGKEIINLGAGELDANIPKFIKEAAINAINQNYNKYTPVSGCQELLEAISQKFQRENKLIFATNEIIASTGAKQAIFNLFMSILNADDEVIIPAPYWLSYIDMAKLTEAKPVVIASNFANKYKISAIQLEKAITNKTKLFVFNNPNNPSGQFYNKQEMIALLQVLRKYPQIIIMTDDIYEHFMWQEKFSNLLNVAQDSGMFAEFKDRVIIINGVSKAYAMTGWRLGYAAANANIISKMKTIQSQSTSNPCIITQQAVISALHGNQQCVSNFATQLNKRHDLLYKFLNNLPLIKIHKSVGTFYMLLDVNQLLQERKLSSDYDLAKMLLTELGIVVIPGSIFGMPNTIRVSYANSIIEIEKAIHKIQKFIC